MRQIYLDYAATTPLAPGVQEAMLPFLSEHYGDPSSPHALGRAAAEAVEDARGHLALLLGADPDEIVLTSGGTEANNLALQGIIFRHAPVAGGHLVISAIEHASVTQTAGFLERLGYDVTSVGVTGQGVVQPQAVRAAIRPDTRLVSVIHANHEVGTIQPLRQIAQICHEHEIPLHTDASQSVGKLRTLVDELEVDLLTLSGHKFYAPKGVGALYVRQGIEISPVLYGDQAEAGLRPGMPNVAAIVGLGRAASLVAKTLDKTHDRMEKLRDLLLSELQAGIGDGLVLHAALADRLPNILSVSFPDTWAHDLLAAVPELFATTGSATHSSAEAISPTLAAMGATPDQVRGALRLSLGWQTTEDDIRRAASLLIGAWERQRT